jgi:hypothetical protein
MTIGDDRPPATGDPAARSALERRYRAFLRAYPAEYRRRRGEEMVATLMDTARPGRRWPEVAEVADLVLSGLRERVGGVRRRLRSPALAGITLAWGVLTVVTAVLALGILLAPLDSSVHCSASADSQPVCVSGHASLLASSGWSAALVVGVPPLICLAATLIHRRWSSWAAATALLLFAGVGIASIGLLILPVVVVAVVIAARDRGDRRPSASGPGLPT